MEASALLARAARLAGLEEGADERGNGTPAAAAAAPGADDAPALAVLPAPLPEGLFGAADAGLPDDAALHVASFLDSRGLAALGLVSRRFGPLAEEAARLWLAGRSEQERGWIPRTGARSWLAAHEQASFPGCFALF